MKIFKLLEMVTDDTNRDYRTSRLNVKCNYLLNKLELAGFEEVAFDESEHGAITQLLGAVKRYRELYGDYSSIVNNFIKVFNPEFVAKIHDYNNHLN